MLGSEPARVVAGIREHIAAVGPPSLRFYMHFTYEVGCNWKVYVGNFPEA